MAYTDNTVSPAELDFLASGAKDKASAKRSNNVIVELGIFLAHAAFYPLAFFALVPKASEVLVGSDMSLIALPFLVLSALIVAATKGIADGGPLVRYGVVIMMLGIIVMVPAMMGFVVLAVTMFAVAGLAAFSIIWKGILFFGFMHWYLNT